VLPTVCLQEGVDSVINRLNITERERGSNSSSSSVLFQFSHRLRC